MKDALQRLPANHEQELRRVHTGGYSPPSKMAAFARKQLRLVCFLVGQYLFSTARLTRRHFISAKIAK